MPDSAPIYPEVEKRKKLTPKQRAMVIIRQHGRCAGCGIKPRHGWEMDHDKALWKGDTDQTDLDTWQAFGSRKDCDCHKVKTANEAGERAEMKRIRTAEERHAARLRMRGTMTPAAYRRAIFEEKLAKGRAAISSRPFSQPELLKTVRSEDPKKLGWGKPEGYVSKLSKKYRQQVKARVEGKMIIKGDSLDLIMSETETPDLIVTDPPYAFGGSSDEHAISATVATVLRESAHRLRKGRWMLVMCASSWRSTSYMVESVRGIVEPVRIATWCKPAARTKVATNGWKWASVNVIAFRKGKAIDPSPATDLDHITAPPMINGRRAELPPVVAEWMVRPFAIEGGLLLDPFAGSGAIIKAGEACGMRVRGYERNPLNQPVAA